MNQTYFCQAAAPQKPALAILLRHAVFILAAFFSLLLYGCGGSGASQEPDATQQETARVLMPELATQPIRNIEATTARSGGVFTREQGRQIISKGVCYHTRPDPSVRGFGSCTDEGDRFGDFNSVMQNLRPETTYFARAYATNSDGTVYGENREFTTRAERLITVETAPPENLDKENRTATLTGRIEGRAADRVGRKGFVWATYPDPQTREQGEDVQLVRVEEQTSRLRAAISGLRYNVQYYARAFAEFDGHTEYGETIPFVLEPYAIGEEGPAGGLIFYYDEEDRYPGFHFLEAAPPMWSGIRGEQRLIWGCAERRINSEGLAIGTGPDNTRRLRQYCNENGSIIAVVEDYAENGYSDWFIPSRRELDLMWSNLHQQGLGDFQPEFYWSSTEQNDENAWGLFFGTGNQRVLPKWLQERVRPIRAF